MSYTINVLNRDTAPLNNYDPYIAYMCIYAYRILVFSHSWNFEWTEAHTAAYEGWFERWRRPTLDKKKQFAIRLNTIVAKLRCCCVDYCALDAKWLQGWAASQKRGRDDGAWKEKGKVQGRIWFSPYELPLGCHSLLHTFAFVTYKAGRYFSTYIDVNIHSRSEMIEVLCLNILFLLFLLCEY
jgi:hypothetical protein